MKTFVDTNVLVAAALFEHPQHKASRKLVLDCKPNKAACAVHSLAELYSTLTRLPHPQRRTAEQAMLFVADIKTRFSLIALTSDEYWAALTEYSSLGIGGGAIYDALIARCALKAKTDVIYTWNVRHFRQFGSDVEKRLRTP